MTDLSVKNVCRVCRIASKRSKLLYRHPRIGEKLSFVGGPLQCESYDELPDHICNKCEEELEFVYTFVVKLKLSKLGINSFCIIKDVERSRNHHTQPFVNDKDSKPDFIDDIQISEDVEVDGFHDKDVDEDILQMSLTESKSIIDMDKRRTLVVDDIDKPTTELPISPIRCTINTDQSAFLNDINKPWCKIETVPFGSNSVIDLDKRPSQVLDDIDKPLAEMETSQIENNSIIDLDNRPILASKCSIKRSKLKSSKSPTSHEVATNICHICGKAFGFISNLVRHIREHEGRRFICTYENCQSFFTQRSSLKLHIAMHKGEKPFRCFLCNKKFTQRKSLQMHLKIHQGKHEYECSYCNRGFYQKTNFDRHLKTLCFSKRTKVWQCVHCKKFFASKQSLNRHNAANGSHE